MTEANRELEEVLANLVFIRGANRPLRELTLDDVRARAAELRQAVGWGPTARVAPIARAWAQLANEMQRHSAETVGELPSEAVLTHASQLWIKL